MDEIVRFENQFYILTTSSFVDDRTRVMKHGNMFAVFDRFGDIQPIGATGQGLYNDGTRFLSQWTLRMNDARPLLLSSAINNDNALLSVDLTNPDIHENGHVLISRGHIHIYRAKFLWKGVCYEHLRVANFALEPIDISLSIQIAADFADIFEVRGITRKRHGQYLPAVAKRQSLALCYEGLDKVIRKSLVVCSPAPESFSPSELVFNKHLMPRQETLIAIEVRCELNSAAPGILSFDEALTEASRSIKEQCSHYCEMTTSSHRFDIWIKRSVADLCTMATHTPSGIYPYAGIPWFSAVFGRDGIITALQTLWTNPLMARGVLSYLAATQAEQVIPDQEAEPGKIIHEMRGGEMAALGEIPFGRYYGSIDSTPLFVLLAGAYYERTADLAFIKSIWPQIDSALKWIDCYGDADGDGFVEYRQRSPRGLTHQGWKDSQDSVFHADGSLAQGSIALCEVQGYVYAAKLKAAALAVVLDRPELAETLRRQAEHLRAQFEKTFWCEELSTYALALDGDKRLCRVRASNAGHCLFTGIAAPERAALTAQTLLDENSFSGWGVRTVASTESRYNPMSYHNGSVWPHDNALIAAGLSRYGMKALALRILSALFDASAIVDLHRLPELICGFRRRSDEGPTLYPVACSPQAWASGALFLLIQSFLGLDIDAPARQITLSRPHLPSFLKEIVIRGLEVNHRTLDLLIHGRAEDVRLDAHASKGSVECVRDSKNEQFVIRLL